MNYSHHSQLTVSIRILLIMDYGSCLSAFYATKRHLACHLSLPILDKNVDGLESISGNLLSQYTLLSTTTSVGCKSIS